MTEKAPDIVDQLVTLAALHQSGALSDAEFDAAKARVLGTEAPQHQLGGVPSQLDKTASERLHRYRSLIVSAVLVVVVVVIVIFAGSASGRRPTAGPPSSLPAGPRVTVVEKPAGKISTQALQQAVRVMARRLSGLGVRGFAVHTRHSRS